MLIPSSLLTGLAVVGLLAIAHILAMGSKYFIHWLKFKSLPLSEEQEKIKFLREHIDQQNLKIKSLEKETEKMTLALLNHIS